MSLINEALKKAQRDRHLDSLPPMPGGGGRGRTAQRKSTGTIILLASGGVALFVVAVVATVLVVNRSPAPSVAAIKAPAKSEAPRAAEPTVVTPIVVLPPSPKPAAETAAILPGPAPAVAAPVVASVVSPAPASPPLARETVPPPTASNTVTFSLTPTRPPQVSEKFDPRVQSLVEGWRITAVRFSGAESKLFMNGSVFRLEDIVDRASGLRWSKVTDTLLTFTDADGLTYTKRY